MFNQSVRSNEIISYTNVLLIAKMNIDSSPKLISFSFSDVRAACCLSVVETVVKTMQTNIINCQPKNFGTLQKNVK